MAGEDVKWLSLSNSGRWLKGKVKRVLGDVAIVTDQSGLTPRHVTMDRLYPIVPRQLRFAGG